MGKHHSVLFLSIMIVSLLSILPSGIGQTSLTTATSTRTLTIQPSNNATSYSATVTSLATSTTSLLVNQTTSLYSTYNSTSTITSTSESSTTTSTPGIDTNLLLIVAVNIIAAVILIFAVMRYVKRRRK